MDGMTLGQSVWVRSCGCEHEITPEVIQSIVAQYVAPLLARIEQLEARPPAAPALPIHRANGAVADARLGTLHMDPEPARRQSEGFNPYRVEPGPQLDELIFRHVLGQERPETLPPPYSSDREEAKKVAAHMKAAFKVTVVSGRTSIPARPWFARIVTIGNHGTEVLAETWPLAICRLALIYATRKHPTDKVALADRRGPPFLNEECGWVERGR